MECHSSYLKHHRESTPCIYISLYYSTHFFIIYLNSCTQIGSNARNNWTRGDAYGFFRLDFSTYPRCIWVTSTRQFHLDICIVLVCNPLFAHISAIDLKKCLWITAIDKLYPNRWFFLCVCPNPIWDMMVNNRTWYSANFLKHHKDAHKNTSKPYIVSGLSCTIFLSLPLFQYTLSSDWMKQKKKPNSYKTLHN